jgi:hypothetical protein
MVKRLWRGMRVGVRGGSESGLIWGISFSLMND